MNSRGGGYRLIAHGVDGPTYGLTIGAGLGEIPAAERENDGVRAGMTEYGRTDGGGAEVTEERAGVTESRG